MQTEHLRTTVMVGWTLGIGTLAYATGVGSLGGWIAAAVLACAPPLILLRFWQPPAETMSESIRNELR